MREKYFLSFMGVLDKLPKVQKFLTEINKVDIWNKYKFWVYRSFYIWADDPALELIRKKARQENWEFLERLERVYTKEELMQCKLLLLTINRAPKGDGGPRYGTKYDMSNACKVCGTGAKQISELIMRESDMPKTRNVTITYHHEIIISKKIKDRFDKEKISNVELRPIKSAKSGKFLDYYQIIPPYKLSPFSKTSKGITTSKLAPQCQACRLNGYYYDNKRPLEIHYDNLDESILKKADIFFTYEHFGVSRINKPFEYSGFAMPLYLITPKVYKIFIELKVKEVRIEPVIVNGFPNFEEWKRGKK